MSDSANPEVPSSRDDEALQPERTGLAWNRTLVVLAVAFGILGVHAYRDGLHIAITIVAGVAATIVLLISSPFTHLRTREARELIVGNFRMMSPLPLALLSVTATTLAVASFVLIMTRG